MAPTLLQPVRSVAFVLGQPAVTDAATPTQTPGAQPFGGETEMSTRLLRRTPVAPGFTFSNFRLYYAGWAPHSTTGDVPLGNAYDTEAAIEYAGAANLATFDGLTTATVEPDTTPGTDPIAVTIPDDTPFWVRCWVDIGQLDHYFACPLIYGGEYTLGSNVVNATGAMTSTVTENPLFGPIVITAEASA